MSQYAKDKLNGSFTAKTLHLIHYAKKHLWKILTHFKHNFWHDDFQIFGSVNDDLEEFTKLTDPFEMTNMVTITIKTSNAKIMLGAFERLYMMMNRGTIQITDFSSNPRKRCIIVKTIFLGLITGSIHLKPSKCHHVNAVPNEFLSKLLYSTSVQQLEDAFTDRITELAREGKIIYPMYVGAKWRDKFLRMRGAEMRKRNQLIRVIRE